MTARAAAARARTRWHKPGSDSAAGVPGLGTVVAPDPRQSPSGASPDSQLVGLMVERNIYAFELFYDRHAAAALGLAQRMVGDRALAEDVTQEAFTSAWRSSYAYRLERGSVRAWVLGITHRRAIDALRHRSAQARLKAREEGFAERVVESAPTEMLALRRWDARRVRRAVETLPNDQRRAIELAYFAGLAHTEIAATLDLPLGTVKSRMRLGLEKLRRAIDPSEIVA